MRLRSAPVYQSRAEPDAGFSLNLIAMRGKTITTTQMWPFVALLLLAAALASPAKADDGLRLATPEWLYSVELPVRDQSIDVREEASADALLYALTRLTGLTSIPRTDAIRTALGNPSRYYNEYVYLDKQAELSLRFTFERESLLALVRQAELPIWWTKRPKVLAWIALEEAGERTILAANSDHPLKEALLDEAMRRGIDLQLPLMDLDDHLRVGVEDVWGRVSASLDEASKRYDADLTLVGRVTSQLSFRGRDLSGDWRFWLAGQVHDLPYQSDQYESVAAVGVGEVVQTLLQRYQVLAHAPYSWEFQISGIRGVGGYAGLVGYMRGLDFIEEVAVAGIQRDVVTLVVATSAQADQLIALLTAEGRLAEDTLHLGSGVQLLWQG